MDMRSAEVSVVMQTLHQINHGEESLEQHGEALNFYCSALQSIQS